MKQFDKGWVCGHVCAIVSLLDIPGNCGKEEAKNLYESAGLTLAQCKEAEVDDCDIEALQEGGLT
jgi:hypothetical protein